jgi:RHS repeat-associated protein
MLDYSMIILLHESNFSASKKNYSCDGDGYRVTYYRWFDPGPPWIQFIGMDGKLLEGKNPLQPPLSAQDHIYFGDELIAVKDCLSHFRCDAEDYSLIFNNHIGYPILAVDLATGATTWQGYHEPFGALLNQVPAMGDTLITPPIARYPGQIQDLFDPDVAQPLFYNNFRWYHPAHGKYLTADPVGLIAGLNLFHYVFNDPINQTDAFGLGACLDK